MNRHRLAADEARLAEDPEAEAWHIAQIEKHIVAKVDATFGPNPCTASAEIAREGQFRPAGQPCDSKRCIYCGPRKEALFQLGTTADFPERPFIGHFERSAECRCSKKKTKPHSCDLDSEVVRLRKAAERGGFVFRYTIVPDLFGGGFWVISNGGLTGTRERSLKKWFRKCRDLYSISIDRVRRSKWLMKVSVIASGLSRKAPKKTSRDTPRAWRRMKQISADEKVAEETRSEMIHAFDRKRQRAEWVEYRKKQDLGLL